MPTTASDLPTRGPWTRDDIAVAKVAVKDGSLGTAVWRIRDRGRRHVADRASGAIGALLASGLAVEIGGHLLALRRLAEAEDRAEAGFRRDEAAIRQGEVVVGPDGRRYDLDEPEEIYGRGYLGEELVAVPRVDANWDADPLRLRAITRWAHFRGAARDCAVAIFAPVGYAMFVATIVSLAIAGLVYFLPRAGIRALARRIRGGSGS